MNTPKASEPSIAERSATALATLESFLRAHRSSLARVRLGDGGAGREPQIAVPTEALVLLTKVLEQLAQGNSVTVSPSSAELSIHAAAELLNVSDSYLGELLDDGALLCQGAGSGRRVRIDDLLAFKRNDLARRRKILSQLTAEAQEMGLYD